MLEFKQTIEEKAYNDMRELVGWRRLDPQQAQTGLDNSIPHMQTPLQPDREPLPYRIRAGWYICFLVC